MRHPDRSSTLYVPQAGREKRLPFPVKNVLGTGPTTVLCSRSHKEWILVPRSDTASPYHLSGTCCMRRRIERRRAAWSNARDHRSQQGPSMEEDQSMTISDRYDHEQVRSVVSLCCIVMLVLGASGWSDKFARIGRSQ